MQVRNLEAALARKWPWARYNSSLNMSFHLNAADSENPSAARIVVETDECSLQIWC